jgi:hypothetical protein
MKNFTQMLLSLIIVAMVPTRVFASDETKQTYQTGELVEDVRVETIDNRVERLKKYLLSVHSPMADVAERFVKEADRLGLDWKLVAAIAGNESSFGLYIPDSSYNGWGWGVWTGTSYGENFQNWEEGITTVSEGLKNNYINDGLQTVDQIGTRYAADPEWAWKVTHFMDEIEAYDLYQKDERLLALSL